MGVGEWEQGFENSLGGTAQGMANSRGLEVGLSSPKRDCLLGHSLTFSHSQNL